MPFEIVRNDITKVKADAIVNTANPKPIYGAGIDFAIYKAAGEQQLLAERKKIGAINRGDAVATPAFMLDAKYIIHTVGPVWKGGTNGEENTLRNCYENSLKLAKELNCHSIAFPLISTGSYGFPQAKALEIAMSTCQHFVLNNDMDVSLIVFGEKAFELSGKVFESIEAYIDDAYVDDAKEFEYSKEYRNEYNIAGRNRYNVYLREKENEDDDSHRITEDEIDLLISKSEITFQQKLFEYIDRSGRKDSDVYNAVGISRSMFSKIRVSTNYQPSKLTALMFCVVLKLSIAESEDLLERASYSFSRSNITDRVFYALMSKGIYEPSAIDGFLVKHGEKAAFSTE